MQVVNCIFVAFEYLILNKKNDYLGGMFGVEHGCNGSLNIYLVIICAYAICRFATKNASLIKVALIILSSVVIAGLSEIKFFYIELAVIILLFVLINRLSFKNVVAIIIGAVALYVAYKVMFSVNNDSLYVFTNLDNLKDYSSNDYGNTRISRTAPISQINTWFFGSNKKYQLFGYGFGACEESKSFSWANSSFASVYGTLQYRNLSASMLYIELGWTGLIAFTLIFVFAFFLIQSKKKYCKQNIQLAIFSQIICVMAIMNMWYNSEIRLSIAYLTYLSIAGATICIKDGYKRSKSEQAIELARLESAQIKGAN
jgi:hypothetical protein